MSWSSGCSFKLVLRSAIQKRRETPEGTGWYNRQWTFERCPTITITREEDPEGKKADHIYVSSPELGLS